MGVVIAIANQKGGVGKTLTTTSLAALLTQEKTPVLTISFDPQRNFDMVGEKGLAIRRVDTTSPSILHVLRGDCGIEDAIVHSERLGDVVRASSQLSQWNGNEISREEYLAVRDNLEALQKILDARVLENNNWKVLDQLLAPIRDKYKYILIDTNPSLTLLTLNSLYTADYVIIPAFSEKTSSEAIIELWDTINSIKYHNPDRKVEILGILMTKCEPRTIAFRRYVRAYEKLAEKINTILFETKIRASARGKDYVDSGIDLINYDPHSTTAQDYRTFLAELKKILKKRGHKV